MAVLKKPSLKSVLQRLKDWFALKAETVFSVNGISPNNGNVTVREVPLAVNLSSEKTQESLGEFVVRTAGGSASIEDGDAFALRILGNRVHTGIVAEELDMTVNAIPREEGVEPITATIDRDTFVAYVATSGTITITYTTEWSADPEDYGITVTGTPIAGDQIVVVYVKENRGEIAVATPTALKSSGWNLYNHTTGYAYVSKYSSEYGFKIGGTYTGVKFATTADATEKQNITPTEGMFSVPSDGYIFVEGGNNTDTYIINVWSDWAEGYTGSFETYSETTVDISAVMTSHFPYGLLRVSDVRDEINLNTSTAISRIGRLAYSAENLASAQASGRPYECDTDYIYIVKANEDTYSITVDGSYTASDHGNEWFVGTDVAVYLETLYGNNLKNKLERDVLTISQQTLTAAQQEQARANIGAGSSGSLSATQDGLAIVANGNTHVAISSGQYVYVKNHSTLAEGLYKATAVIAANATLSISNLTADSNGGLNSLSDQIANLVHMSLTVNDLLDIPLNTTGYVGFSTASISPLNNTTSMFAYHCFGSTNRRCLIATYTAGSLRMFVNTYHTDTWKGWKEITLA